MATTEAAEKEASNSKLKTYDQQNQGSSAERKPDANLPTGGEVDLVDQRSEAFGFRLPIQQHVPLSSRDKWVLLQYTSPRLQQGSRDGGLENRFH